MPCLTCCDFEIFRSTYILQTMTAVMYACGAIASFMLTSTLLVVLLKVSASQREYVPTGDLVRCGHGLMLTPRPASAASLTGSWCIALIPVRG